MMCPMMSAPVPAKLYGGRAEMLEVPCVSNKCMLWVNIDPKDPSKGMCAPAIQVKLTNELLPQMIMLNSMIGNLYEIGVKGNPLLKDDYEELLKFKKDHTEMKAAFASANTPPVKGA